jgi:hypothetical protein
MNSACVGSAINCARFGLCLTVWHHRQYVGNAYAFLFVLLLLELHPIRVLSSALFLSFLNIRHKQWVILDGYQADGRPREKEKAVSNIHCLTGIRTHSSSVIVVDSLIQVTGFHNCIPKICLVHYWNRKLYCAFFTDFIVNGIQKRILQCSFIVPMRRNTVAKVTYSKTLSRVIRKWNVGLPKRNEFTWVMAMWPVKFQMGLQMKPKFSLNTPLNQSSVLHLPRQAISIDTHRNACAEFPFAQTTVR